MAFSLEMFQGRFAGILPRDDKAVTPQAGARRRGGSAAWNARDFPAPFQ
jgi:hypothetical protein